jgi:hypothetical protein
MTKTGWKAILAAIVIGFSALFLAPTACVPADGSEGETVAVAENMAKPAVSTGAATSGSGETETASVDRTAEKSAASGFDYVLCYADDVECETFPMPELPRPAKGEPLADPSCNTEIVRVTDRRVDGAGCTTFVNSYSTVKIENADNTLLLVSCGAHNYFLYDAETLEFIKPLKIDGRRRNPEPYWDPEDPNVFYWRQGMRFLKYDVEAGKSTLVRDFSKDFKGGRDIYNATKGEPSRDGRYWAFVVFESCCPVKVVDWFVYDKQEDTIRKWNESPAGADTPAYNVKWIGMSPSGKWVITKNAGGGHFIAPSDFSEPRRFLAPDSHSDLAIDSEGNEVLVARADLGKGNGQSVSMYELSTGKLTPLLQVPRGARGFHMSGNNYDRPGWALISTYEPVQNTWTAFSLFMLELDPNKCWNCDEKPRVWRISNTYSTLKGVPRKGSYWAQAFATISEDGLGVYWGNNWLDPMGSIDLYRANLPQTWAEDLD